jgi:triosephosphate isomerase (TIM)
MQKRTPIIAGNWKMNNTIEEGLELVKAIHYGINYPTKAEIVVAPTFVAISKIAEALKDSFIKIAGQDLFWENSGAYTGAISAPLLKNVGAEYVIIGHSERRQYFGETDETVNKKTKAALAHALIPIVCVGETLGQRESGQVSDVVTFQVVEGLKGMTSTQVAGLVIAYEPVWAIGTGKTATSAQAEEVHVIIRDVLAKEFGKDAAQKTRILYGGSVKPSNSKELLSLENIDGALVGGASLKAADFIGIIQSYS